MSENWTAAMRAARSDLQRAREDVQREHITELAKAFQRRLIDAQKAQKAVVLRTSDGGLFGSYVYHVDSVWAILLEDHDRYHYIPLELISTMTEVGR